MILTKAAEQQVTELLKTDQDAVAVRIGIVGGGCSGFNYTFSFSETVEDDDTVIEYSDAKVVVDPMSLQYLGEATVDYQTDLSGARFVISNPIASATCGCGTSFSV